MDPKAANAAGGGRWGRGDSTGAPADPLAGGGIWRDLLEAARVNIFVANPKLELVYANRKAQETLQNLRGDIGRVFGVQLADVLGGSIHRFHRDPARVEKILRSTTFTPHDARFTFGATTLDTHINRITDARGEVLAYVVAWEDISEQERTAAHARTVNERLGQTVTETDEVNAGLQAVATAMEEMSATVNEIARHGASATSTAQAAVVTVNAANDTVAALGTASTEIGDIVQTITKVAEQTNLLALNATIEAARAGTAGKGFAVVAGEVKDLSKQTKSATTRIEQMIDNVQRLSRDAVAAITEIARVVEQVKENQTSIASAVEEQSVTVAEISRSLATTAQAVQSVTFGVKEFVNSTQ